jgi:hypothetical protein
MAITPRPTSLIIIIIILLISNIVLGAAWWYSKNYHTYSGMKERPSQMAAYLKSEVGFSAEQLVAFDSLRAQKRRAEKDVYKNIKDSKQELFKSLGANEFSDSAVQQTIDFASDKQRILEASMLSTLKDIRLLCTEEQRAKFDTGFYKAFIRNWPEGKK